MIINGESKAQRSGSQQAADSDGRQLGRSLLSSVVEWFGRYEIETFEIVLYELTALRIASRESSSGRGEHPTYRVFGRCRAIYGPSSATMRSHQVQSGDGVPVSHAHGGSRKRGRRIKLTVVGAALMSMYTIFLYAVMVSFDKSGHRELHEDRTSAVSASLRAGGGRDPLKESLDARASLRASLQQRKEEPKKRPRALIIEDFCGMCQWRDMPFNCNERVEWVVKQKGASETEAKESNLKFCTLPGCNAKANDEGFMQCEDLSTPGAKPDLATYPKVKHVDKAPELDAILSGSLLKDLFSRDIDITERIKSTKKVNEEGLRDRRSGEDLVASVLAAAKLGDREYDTEETSSARQQAVLGGHGGRTADMPILTAYIEPINQTDWEQRPLPVRDGPSTKKTLFGVSYPNLHSCRAMQSQFPIDTPPVDLDSYLPWIHDVFPSHDGKDIIFIAQNRRRCYNGQRRMQMGEKAPDGVTTHKNYIHIDYGKNYFQRPQSALFQHVPVKKIGEEDGEPRYRLASHEDADKEGMETRFICRFKLFDSSASPNLSIVGYSLSAHEVDYDYHTYRKGYRYSATEAGFDNHMIWQSQLLFRCPVPEEYHNKVSRGELVVNDYATLYVDVVPIRTPPRYTPPREFLQPRYEFKNEIDNLFVPDFEWGKEHVLPKIDQSGRWENIPVCLPSLMNHGLLPEGADINEQDVIVENDADGKYVPFSGVLPPKIHKVIACTWASTTFRTRSNRASVGDGKRRLKEWLEFNLLSGFDHIYVYDNSGAFTNEDSLADIIELFPERVTRVDWPCKICSNRDGNEGERSSQYAAESSCRIRFGAHARWLGSFDTGEECR